MDLIIIGNFEYRIIKVFFPNSQAKIQLVSALFLGGGGDYLAVLLDRPLYTKMINGNLIVKTWENKRDAQSLLLNQVAFCSSL